MSPRKVLSSMSQAQIDQAQRYEETIEALRRAEQKYRSIFENATEGIFQTTPEGKYLSANPALARMYGYDSPGELLADLTDISRQLYVEPDCRRKFTLAMRRDGRIQDFESQIHRRDGSVIWISENARAVYDEVSGELLYYEGMVQDITPRKSAEEARKQAEENLVRYAEELRVKNAQFEADLEMARDIQQVFLMQNYPSFPRSLTPEESWLGFLPLVPAGRAGRRRFFLRSAVVRHGSRRVHLRRTWPWTAGCASDGDRSRAARRVNADRNGSGPSAFRN
jgi:PAS domain S-box-containing protein